jgi:pimeloyl-ACP methyl ester carboxylesterase
VSIVPRFHAWSDRRRQPFDALFTQEQLLTEIMLYLVTDAFGTSIWIYAGEEHERFFVLSPGRRIEAPVGLAAFPDPVFKPLPRAIAENSHNVIRYTEMPRGGHFPFYEAPDLLVDDLTQFSSDVFGA